MLTAHERLGIPKNANRQTIKRAYRKLALRYHPDKNPGGEAEFKAILAAYETLCPRKTRKQGKIALDIKRSSYSIDWTKKIAFRFRTFRDPFASVIIQTSLLNYDEVKSALLNKIEEAIINDRFAQQISLFLSLADAYFKDTVLEKWLNWEPIVYASALYNYALSLAYEYQELALVPLLQAKVYEIKQAFLQHLGLTYQTTQAMDLLVIKQRQLKLRQLRQQIKADYEEGQLEINSLFEKMGIATKEFFIEIFESAMNSINANYNKHSFSILSLCSGATNRMHYHSDLDFMILCDEQANKGFLMHFSLVAYLLVLELQETPLRFISIPGLEFMQAYYRYPRSNNGLKYDARKGGAFPLLSKNICKKGSFQLLGTPEEMISLFKNHMDCELNKEHTLSVKCINTDLLYGNADLYQRFKSLLESLLAEGSELQGYSFAQITGSRLYAQDIKNAVFPLRDAYLFKHHLKSFEYVISSLGLMHHRFNTDQEGIVSWLVQQEKIRPCDADRLLDSFRWLKKIRLEMNIVNGSANVDLPILWNYAVFNKYRFKTPALSYFLRDLLGLTHFYCLVQNMSKLLPDLVLLSNAKPLPLDLTSPAPIYDVLIYISNQIRRNNIEDYREFEVFEAYNAFPAHFIYPKSINEYFQQQKPAERRLFLEKTLHVGLCFASHYFSIGNSKEAGILLNRLLSFAQQYLSTEKRLWAILDNKHSYSLNEYTQFIEEMAKINPTFPTLLAILYYMLGRCYFYDPDHYPQDLASHQLQVAKIFRQLIDARLFSQVWTMDDRYNEKNMDTVLIERSGILRMALIRCDKSSSFDLKKIQQRYQDIMDRYEDPIHNIECHCMMLRIDAYLLAACRTNPNSQSSVLRVAEERIKILSAFLENNNYYTYQQKILNVLAVWELAQNSSQKAQFLLNKDNSFFRRVKNSQHLREQAALKAQCC